MNRECARIVLNQKLDELRKLTHGELLTLLDRPSFDRVKGQDGVEYQVETQAFWDNKKKRNIRVVVAVDDGGIRAMMPLTGTLIVSPDGSFIG
jgi:hypothetical protein